MEEGDLVLCTVEDVTNTITSVRLPTGEEGTLVSSEIAPGRIKHMRQYVVPNKKIVCKILDVSKSGIHLSLRRVNSKEKKEVMEKWKNEQASKVAFKQILGENAQVIEEKILVDYRDLAIFIDEMKLDESLLVKYIPSEKIEAIKKITERKQRNQELKQIIKLKCLGEDGVKKIKQILDLKDPSAMVSYISAGKFNIKLIVEDFKQGKKKMAEILEDLEKQAKENHCEFFISEEK